VGAALLTTVCLGLTGPSPFLRMPPATSPSRLFALDELELADGTRGEVHVVHLLQHRGRWTLGCRTPRGLVRVPLTSISRAHLCDGSRIVRAKDITEASAVTVAGARVAGELLAAERTKDSVFSWRITAGLRGAKFRRLDMAEGFVILPGYARLVPGWGWRRIHVGQTQAEVERLLGGPPVREQWGWLAYTGDGETVRVRVKNDRVWSVTISPPVPLLAGLTVGAAAADAMAVLPKPARVVLDRPPGGQAGTLYVTGAGRRYVTPDGGLMLGFRSGRLDGMVALLPPGVRADSIVSPLPTPQKQAAPAKAP